MCVGLEQWANISAIATFITTIVMTIGGWYLLWKIPYKQSQLMSECKEITDILELMYSVKFQVQSLGIKSTYVEFLEELIVEQEQEYIKIRVPACEDIENCRIKLNALSEGGNDVFFKLSEELYEVKIILTDAWVNFGCVLNLIKTRQSPSVQNPEQEIARLMSEIQKLPQRLDEVIDNMKKIRSDRQKPIKVYIKEHGEKLLIWVFVVLSLFFPDALK